MRNLINKVFFNFFVMGIFFQSCDQKAILPDVEDQLEIIEPVEVSYDNSDSEEENTFYQEPYHDDPYFDYVLEYRYKDNVYTYEDKEKRSELEQLLERENIMVFIGKDLDEALEYQAEHADIPIENRDMSLEPADKIAYVFDTEEKTDVFLEEHYHPQINAMRGNLDERGTCFQGFFNVQLRLYSWSNYNGGGVVMNFSHLAYAGLERKKNIPSWFNDRLSSMKMKLIELPSNGFPNRPRVNLYRHINAYQRCVGYIWNRYCQPIHVGLSKVTNGCDDETSSIGVQVVY